MRLKQNKVTRFLIDALHIIAGSFLLAFAITVILKPNHLITGGTTGFSIVLEKLTGIDFTVLYYALSILILIITLIFLGRAEAKKILLLSVVIPTVLMGFSRFFQGEGYNLTKGDMFLSSIYYGILAGIGVGLFMKRGYSSGGTDSLAKMLHRRLFPFISISQILTGLDLVVIGSSVLVFDIRTALYAILSQLVFMKSVEAVLYGFSPKLVKVEIISQEEADIEHYILKEIQRGITKYNIVGAYSSLERIKLVTICSQRESMLIREKIAEIDEAAFVSVIPVVSVWGKGVNFDNLIEEVR